MSVSNSRCCSIFIFPGSLLFPRQIFVVMDKSAVWRVGMGEYNRAVELLMALQFVFHVTYAAPFTLEFIQR